MNRRIALIFLLPISICRGAAESLNPRNREVVLYHPYIDVPLPPVILAIIFKFLKKTAYTESTFIITEGNYAQLTESRPILQSERIACIIGSNTHGHEHGLFNNSALFNKTHIQINQTLAKRMLSYQLKNDLELSALASRPYAPFSIPSLAELLITGKLTQEFYEKNKKLVEENIAEDDYDSGPPVYEADMCSSQ